MNKAIAALAGLVILALVAGFMLTGNEEDAAISSTSEESSMMVQEASGDPTQRQENIELQSAGQRGILTYSPSALASSDTDKNIIFFHAQWCTVCNSVKQNIEAAAIPDDVSIFLVDYDSSEGKALAEQYDIPIQYTMVQVDNTGSEITQWVNSFGDGISEITERLQAV